MKIFIVEDDRFYCRLIEHHLKLNPDFEVETFQTGKQLLDKLVENPDIVTLDYTLPDMNGHEVLINIKRYDPGIHVIVISGQDDVTVAVNLLKEGAYDYITKDENIRERLFNTIHNIHTTENLRSQVKNLKTQISEKYDSSRAIIGESKAIGNIFSVIDKAIRVQNMTVSIRGETGTGKELVARTIHFNSIRKDKPFITVNMGAIPRELLESELFGHEKGAFTGAVSRNIGKFEEANGGTIFFDEIAEMDFDLQVKILRAVQEREITRVGGNSVIRIDVRIITATNKDLLEEVRRGRFREDLYYRLMGLPINMPRLSERENDIMILTNHFIREFTLENKLPRKELSASARHKLLSYHFPGNVRELKAIVELAVVMSNSDTIEADDLMMNPISSSADLVGPEMTLREYEAKIIRHYLDKFNNNVILVARKLDIGKSKIYNMIRNGEL